MELRIQPDGQTVLATANVAHGWRQLTNTFGFCAECRLDVPQDKILRVKAAIRAWPNRLGSQLFRYPQNVYGLIKADWGRVELRDEELQISMDLSVIRLLRLHRSGLPGVYQPPSEVDKQGRIGFWFSVLVLLLDGARTEYPDIMEWDTQFQMGGLPGSSRRH